MTHNAVLDDVVAGRVEGELGEGGEGELREL